MCRAPGVQVVALVPVAGPVPPPMNVVTPLASASYDLLRADEVDVRVDAAGGEDQPLAGDRLGRDADDHPVGDAGHHVRVAGLADAGDAAVLDADVGLADAGPVDDQRVGDDAVERAARRRRRPPGPCRRAAPCRRRTCTRRRRRSRRARPRRRGPCRRAGPGRRWSGRRCRRSAGGRCGGSSPLLPGRRTAASRTAATAARAPSSVTGPSARALPPRMTRSPAIATSVTVLRLARLEAHRGAGRNVEPHAVGGAAIEHERAVGLDEVIVAADLNRPIAAVGHGQLHGRRGPR